MKSWHLRRWLWGRPCSVAHGLQAQRAAVLVRLAYFFPLYWGLSRLPKIQAAIAAPVSQRLWPVRWFPEVLSQGQLRLSVSCLILTLAVGAIACRFRWGRVAVFAALIHQMAFEFSFGKIHHLMHAWLVVLGLWIFLPAGWHTPASLTSRARLQMLLLFAAAQFAFALTYSLSGLGKLLGGLYQLALGEVTVFHPSAMARHVASRISQTGEDSMLGAFVVQLGGVMWPLMILNLCAQVSAVAWVRGPARQRWLGYYIVAFHTIASLVLTIDFSPAVLLAALLLIASPFTPAAKRLARPAVGTPESY